MKDLSLIKVSVVVKDDSWSEGGTRMDRLSYRLNTDESQALVDQIHKKQPPQTEGGPNTGSTNQDKYDLDLGPKRTAKHIYQ